MTCAFLSQKPQISTSFFFAMSVKSYLFDPSRSTISDMEVHDFFMFLLVIFSPLFVLFR